MKKRFKLINLVLYLILLTFFILIFISTKYGTYFLEKNLEDELSSQRNTVINHEKEKLKIEVNAMIETIELEERISKKNLMEDIKLKVEELSDFIKKSEINPEYPEEEKLFFDVLKIYVNKNQRKNLFIWNYDGKIVYNSELSKYIQNDYSELENKGLKELFIELKETFKFRSSGFKEYNLVVDGKIEKKMAYIKWIPEKKWYLGISENLELFEKNFKKEFVENLLVIPASTEKTSLLYIIDSQGEILYYPKMKNSKKIYVKELLDGKGEELFKLQRELADKDRNGGFYNFDFGLEGMGSNKEKVAFVKAYPKYSWYIGSIINIEKLSSQLEKLKKSKETEIRIITKNLVYMVIIVMLLFSIVIIIINNYLAKDFERLQLFLINAVEKNQKIDLDKLKFHDFFLLGEKANKMIEEKIKIEEKLKYMATKDSLTNLLNRRAFFEKLKEEFKRSKRYKTPLTVFMIDIDFFKKVNDNYGHLIGDIVLREFSKQCEEIIRDIDIIGRVGGEEFAIIAPNTDKESGRIVGERIVEYFRENPVHIDLNLKITVSIGIEDNLSKEFHTGNELLNAADRMLYKAKATGRNKVYY